ncbi:hypothetical protein BGW80DRAFT_1230320 [Lactifluus volemus]|nr:hypothetical protein BGW80DRAFT_1230320 [Lactifluus volemus]
MFATLSSFLPSALQQNSPNPGNSTSKDDPTVHAGETKPTEVVGSDEVGVKRKERKFNHESFIVVRPPPAKSNHPLNLQVQLVPPQSRDRTRSMDTSLSQDQDENGLSRTTSNRSDVSMYSGYSSVASFSSVASSSTASSRRMIIPLYNLQAHNVMTNIIVDAGTDAKVAKFQKRGLEIVGLATLEPIEVFGSNPAIATQFPSPSNRPSIDDHHDPIHSIPRPGTSDGVHTPASSSLSLTSGSVDATSPTAPVVVRTDNNLTPTTGSKKILGRFFKKRDTQSSSPPSSSPLSSPLSNSFFRAPRPTGQSFMIPQRSSKRDSKPGPGQHSESSMSPPSSIHTNPHLQPAVLGVHPSCSSPILPPKGRPHSYTWVVRKWIKGSNDGLLGNVIGHMNSLSLSDERRQSRNQPEEGAVEVLFVWTRGKKKKRKSSESGRPAGGRRSNVTGPPRSPSPSLNHPGLMDRTEKRLSTLSGHSISTASELDGAAGRARRDDDGGDESDPEDSETPWTCTVVISRLGSVGGAASTNGSSRGSGDSPVVRVRVATFSPTPHHPKVVALLKVPFPLPDIIVDRLQVCRRVVNAQGIARPSCDLDAVEGLVLTAEEIKDVVSSTGLWLVVRESIGGVGKINRKGDGWRIRA